MNPEKLEKLKFLQNNRPFLGREYLTWLWFAMESSNHIIDVPGYEPFHLYVNDKLVLSSPGGSVREHSLKGGTPAYASEAKTALRSGKLVSEVNFVMKQDNKRWTWSQKADDLFLRNLRLPPVESEDPENYLQNRLENTDAVLSVCDHLFDRFLQLRLGKGFSKEMVELTHWAQA